MRSAGDPMSWAAEAPELLMSRWSMSPGSGCLATHDGGCGSEGRQVVEASPLEPAGDGAVANSTLLADLAIGLAATPLRDHLNPTAAGKAWGRFRRDERSTSPASPPRGNAATICRAVRTPTPLVGQLFRPQPTVEHAANK